MARLTTTPSRLALLVSLTGAALALAFAGCAGCDGDTDVAATGGAGPGQGGGGSGGGLTIGAGGGVTDCSVPCPDGEVCSHGVCIPLVPCTDDDECQYDTYCDPQVGCSPWADADPNFDPNCIQVTASGVLQPSIQCEFSTPPINDAFPDHVDVQGTPIVIHLSPSTNMPDQAGTGPSRIAASFTATVPSNYTENFGVIRVLNGNDCTLEANLGGVDVDNDQVVDWIVSSSSLAGGDLDGDNVPEIVAYGADGSTLAFTFKNGSWSLLWKAAYPSGAVWAPCTVNNSRCSVGWAGASIHDIDDDGIAEVIREGAVFSNTGTLLSLHPTSYLSYSQGLFPVLANLDQDAAIELTNGQFVWEWVSGAWQQETYFPGQSASAAGHVAVADFGDYGNGVPPTNPEIAVVRTGSVMIYAITGELVLGPITVPGGGSGGPPTVSDFDGDGLAELAVAAQGAYTIYDIDCGSAPRAGGVCPPGTCDFNSGPCPTDIAWSRSTQDISSSVTGSSVFDFEADGKSEVVYGDECFVRVYDGSTGEVLFSQFRSSCTWHENPIIADVDGDFRAELITPSNKACSVGGLGVPCTGLNGDGVDQQFNGLRCDTANDCVSQVCDQGLCRCIDSGQCCGALNSQICEDEGYRCAAPEPGTLGTGNTCRASHPDGVSGIRVYSDANDQWVSSRRIWNQHAYAVTHVNETGSIPMTSQWGNNWDDPQLNNFRQNVPGSANGQAIGDTTAGASTLFSCQGNEVTLLVDVCNRGALPIPANVPVGFYVSGMKICDTQTTMQLFPGECEQVQCVWSSAPTTSSAAVDVTVVADDGNTLSECKEGNNTGGIFDVHCEPPS
jgi:hypothetical protein